MGQSLLIFRACRCVFLYWHFLSHLFPYLYLPAQVCNWSENCHTASTPVSGFARSSCFPRPVTVCQVSVNSGFEELSDTCVFTAKKNGFLWTYTMFAKKRKYWGGDGDLNFLMSLSASLMPSGSFSLKLMPSCSLEKYFLQLFLI